MATDTSTDTDTSTGIARAVLLAGIALGTCLTILVMWDGVRLRIPDLPSIIGTALGAVIVWVLFMGAASALSELTRRHHRAVLRHGWRHSKRGARAAYRGAANRSRPWRTRFLTAIRARWDGRGIDPPWWLEAPPPDEPSSDPAPVTPARRVCAACGNPEGGEFGPLVTYRETEGPILETHLIHRAHFEDPATGYYGQPYSPPVTDTTPPGETMTETTNPAIPAPRSGGRRVLTIGGAVPGEWKNLVAITADFEPEDDADLLTWMAAEVNGMSAYAEALTEVYETGVSSVGLDPVSLAALHDTADAAADAAQAMSYARQKFASHYAEVREFAASGGLLPHDGRWITGDGE